ncbi:MAG TPA: ribosome small subunit-dependent GTPase A [Oscillospiraceae bacterium]|nr:ribosome small subunit-dependent GTPase A [Oscillospiraceae bacterium]
MELKNAEQNNGIIIKAVGGLYFVKTPDGVYECKARGIFRKREISPCAGDNVSIQDNVITEILLRKNSIIRPPLANLDQLIFVISTCEPSPNYNVIDKFVAVSEYKGIEPIIAITKIDLNKSEEIKEVYNSSGIKVLTIDYSDSKSCDELYSALENKISAFTGNSGVGKSTLLNHIDLTLCAQTNEISRKLGRGKHTTRQVELFQLDNGGFIADTPGFSSFETNKYDIIRKEDLSSCFREFSKYSDKCMFHDCSHTKEKGCSVIEAVNKGEISKSRHESYVEMYEEAKNIKEWENK